MYIDEDEQNKILDHVRHQVCRAYFLFLMKMGWRPGEARALRWEGVDLKKGLVVIKAAMDGNTYRPTTKAGDVRHLACTPGSGVLWKGCPPPCASRTTYFPSAASP